jgi:hypothetical protein
MQDGFTLAFFSKIIRPLLSKCDDSNNIKLLILNQLRQLTTFQLGFDIRCNII